MISIVRSRRSSSSEDPWSPV